MRAFRRLSAASIGLFALFGLGAPGRALATSVDPAAPLPPGHPAVGTDDAEPDTDGSAEPGAGAAPSLPPGHPGAPAGEPPQDRASPAPDLRAGTIEVHVHDGSENPFPNLPIKLGVVHQDVAEGDSHSQVAGKTDEHGVAIFQGLLTGTAYSYRVTVDREGGSFASEQLRLGESGGQRVLLHVFPVTHSLNEALIGMRGVLYIEPREDVFQFEANFQVLNIGALAWVPSDVRIALPDGAKAFRASDSTSDARVERPGTGALNLLGTFSPGQHEVGFQFHVDNTHERRRSFRIALPPHVAELRVIAAGARSLVFHVDGFPDAEPMQGQDGSRLLVTGRRLVRGEPALDIVEITLDNLPVPSPGRWYAVVIALGFAGFGLFSSFGGRGSRASSAESVKETREAEELVLDELVVLEKLRREDRIGPRAYEETRVELLNALARLELRRGLSA